MNGNMNLGKRVTLLEKDGGADIKKEISDLQAAVTEMQTSVSTTQEEITNLETKVNSGHVYSTVEKLVGTWIDGKPIYEISYYTLNIPASTTSATVLGTISNIDKMITITGTWKWEGDTDVQAIGNRGGNKAWCDVFRQNDSIKVASNAGCEYLIAILQYTKTTDNPTQ